MWERVIFFFSVMRHFDTKAQMHIKNAYPKGPTTITATTAVAAAAAGGAAASVTTSQVSLAKALKYAEISLGSCAACLRLDALPSSARPAHPAGQSAVILANAPVSLTTPLWPKMKAQKKSQLLLGIVSYRLMAGGGGKAGSRAGRPEGKGNIVIKMLLARQFFSFLFPVSSFPAASLNSSCSKRGC